MKAIATIAIILFIVGFVIPKTMTMFLNFIDRQFSDALPDDEEVEDEH